MSHAIAIVGLACIYADADSPQKLWENVLAKRRAFRRIPAERLSLDDYYRPGVPDGIDVQEAAVIEGWVFDRVRFRVAGTTYRSTDPTHWLALDVADRALRDAGFPEGDGLPRERTGVLLGNTLTGEFSRAELLRLRWPYVRRVVAARLRERGWAKTDLAQFLDELEREYKAPFAPMTEESLAGGLSNTIAGRICNHFHLQGGGYTLDGACSSSLLAVNHACTALAQGDLDVALAGGVDLSLDPFELVGFSRIGALAQGPMRVYDQDTTGFLPGEGCGFAVLMREDEALARGLRSYALIRGWGMSSDGAGGITRPEVAGQRLALERAYARAGFGIDSVTLFEGHGTGTIVGDEVELATLAEARLGADPGAQPAVISAVKANIGHTKAAAGIAGLIKTVMSLQAQVLPPMTGMDHPHPRISAERAPLRLLRKPEAWPQDRPLRAGVSSFGFGGINVHIALEGTSATRRTGLTAAEQQLARSRQDAELFLLGAPDPADLARQIRDLAALAPRLAHAELADLASMLASAAGRYRAAVVAGTPLELARGLEDLLRSLERGETRVLGADTFLWADHDPPRIAFLFPGQASPVRFNGGAMAERFPEIEQLYRDAGLEAGDPRSTEIAQPAIVAAELAGLRVLDRLGLKADLALGHSLGELTALHWAGSLDAADLLRLARLRGRAMAGAHGPAGAMASVAARPEAVAPLLRPGIVIAGLNATDQTVVSGEEEALARLLAQAAGFGLRATRLPVSHAFHSPLMQPAARVLGQALKETRLSSCRRMVFSTVTGEALGDSEDLRLLLERQLTTPVLFTQALGHLLNACDLCLEVGPGRVLTGLLPSLKPAYAVDAAGASLRGLLQAVGAAYALGAPLNARKLFDDRLIRPFNIGRPLHFLANPCEQAPPLESEGFVKVADPVVPELSSSAVAPEPASDQGDGGQNLLELVRTAVAQRAELPLSAVEDRARLLQDLHLNSISVGQLVAEVAKRAGLPAPAAPTDYALATVATVAAALDALRGSGPAAPPEAFPAGLDSWVRAFGVTLVETPLPPGADTPSHGSWQVIAPEGHALAGPLRDALEAWGGGGVVVCLGAPDETEDARLLLAGSRLALEHDGEARYFVVLEGERPAGGFAKTLFLEASELRVCVLNMPLSAETPARVVAELRATRGFSEVLYDAEARRWEPRLGLLDLSEDSGPCLRPDDVLLVSGGGKGISAECAAALAEETGASLALLGRSDPAQDRELAENLARLAAKGIRHRYIIADVTDAEAVSAAVAQAGSVLGPVTALLHGAGLNEPRLLRDLGEADLRKTLAPKLDGLRNLLAAVDPDRLRLLLTFSSVIARTGMRGEADYALANDWLSRMTRSFGLRHPACRCLALEWSLWSGVGMGERLGRVDALLREGIAPISLEMGIGLLRRLVRCGPQNGGVVMAGRLGGGASTLKFSAPNVPFLRFLDRPRVYYPGVELVVDFELAEGSDPYLDEHVFQGERLFPTVMGMEAMAQAAMALLDRQDVPCMEDLQLLRPVVAAQGDATLVRLCALARAPDEVEVALRSEATGYQVDHFRARCRFTKPPSPDRQPVPAGHLALDPRQDLYGGLLFHQGRFVRLAAYRELTAQHCWADITAPDEQPWFGRYHPETLLLGDPGSRDAALHALQACIPHVIVLPTSVERWVPCRLDLGAPWLVKAAERWRDGDRYCYDLAVLDRAGETRERWEGLILRRVAPAPPRDHWPSALLGPYLSRCLAEILGAEAPALALVRESAMQRRERSNLALQAILGEGVAVFLRPDGKPEVPGGHQVSTSHANDLTLAVASGGVVACDLEPVTERSEDAWADLLGSERLGLAHLIAEETTAPLAAAATRVWCAAECMVKAGLPATSPITLEQVRLDGWVLLRAGGACVATWLVKIEAARPPYGVAVLAGAAAQIPAVGQRRGV